MTPKHLISVGEAAEALSLGRTFVYEEVMRGRIRSVAAGRRRLIPVKALDDYIQLLEADQTASAVVGIHADRPNPTERR